MAFQSEWKPARPISKLFEGWAVFTIITLLLSGCNLSVTQSAQTATPASTNTPSPTATLVATSTPTPPPSTALFIIPPQADQPLASEIKPTLEQLAKGSGMRFSVQSGLDARDLTPEVKVVVLLPPFDSLESLASAAMTTQFIALGFAGLQPAANLSVIGGSDRPDQIGFMAGVIAAMLTEDWRVGIISLSDTPAGNAARLGFQSGVVYFCGLCRPYYPPSVAYPIIAQLPSNASQTEGQAAAQTMIGQSVKTVYVYPGAGDEAMLATLTQAGIHLIGGTSPTNSSQAAWIASLKMDILPALQTAWPQVLSGKGGLQIPANLIITDVNPALFSQGRQDLAKKIMSDLTSGAIDTKVDPLTGNSH